MSVVPKINMSVVPKVNTDVHKRCEEVRDESQLKMFDKWTLGHTVQGVCAGGIILVFRNPVLALILFNIFHAIFEWYEVLYKNSNEYYGNMMINKIGDVLVFLAGSIVSATVVSMYFNKQNKIYNTYIVPICLLFLIYLFLYEFRSSSQYEGIGRYGKSTKTIDNAILFMISICTVLIISGVNRC